MAKYKNPTNAHPATSSTLSTATPQSARGEFAAQLEK